MNFTLLIHKTYTTIGTTNIKTVNPFVRINEVQSGIVMSPIINFIKRYGKFAVSILILIGLYRIADVVMGVVANIFYLEKGFNVKEIATYSKFFGVFATIVGGFLGGFFSLRFGSIG